jgi:hypothetical protein
MVLQVRFGNLRRSSVALVLVWVVLLFLSTLWLLWSRQRVPPAGTQAVLKDFTSARETALNERLVELFLSVGSPGHCTVLLGLDEEPRCPQWSRLRLWFDSKPRSGFRYLEPSDPIVKETVRLLRASGTAPLLDPQNVIGGNAQTSIGLLHLIAMQWMLESGCQTMAVFEDDISLDLLPYWEEPLASLTSQLALSERLALQLDTRLVALTDKLGRHTELKLELLPRNCTHRHWISYEQHKTLGTGAYILTSSGARRILQRLGDGNQLDPERLKKHLGNIDNSSIFHPADLVSLWPPYVMTWDPSTYLPWTYNEMECRDRVLHASAIVTATANLQRAAACAFLRG